MRYEIYRDDRWGWRIKFTSGDTSVTSESVPNLPTALAAVDAMRKSADAVVDVIEEDNGHQILRG